jgi:hypothetical protein
VSALHARPGEVRLARWYLRALGGLATLTEGCKAGGVLRADLGDDEAARVVTMAREVAAQAAKVLEVSPCGAAASVLEEDVAGMDPRALVDELGHAEGAVLARTVSAALYTLRAQQDLQEARAAGGSR